MSLVKERSVLAKPLPEFIIRGFPSSVTAICFVTIDSKHQLICGTDCGQLSMWSLKTYRCESIINNANNSRVQQLIAFDDQFLCQHKNGFIDVFDRQLSVKKSYSISDSTFCKCFLYLNPNPKYLGFVSKTNNCLIDIIDFNCNKTVITVGKTDGTYGWPFTLFMAPIDRNAINCDIVLVLIGYENGFLTLFRADPNRNESQIMSQLKCFESMITSIDFNYDNMCGICCSVTDVISVWTLSSTPDKSTLTLSLKSDLKITNNGLSSCSIRPDGRIFACGGTDGRIRVFGLKSLKALAVISSHSETIECLLFSHKLFAKQMQILLVVGSKDRTISVWNLYNNL